MVALLHRPMRLAGDYDQPDRFDRRTFQRRPVRGSAHAQRLDHAIASRQNPRLTLELRDLSVGGVSAISDLPVHPGERIRVSLHPEGATPFHAFGRIVRCEMSGMGYRVAIAFDALPQAA